MPRLNYLKNIALVTGLALLLIAEASQAKEEKIVRINNCSFQTEIADTLLLRQRGLSGRKQLAENAAMLFVFEQAAYYGFWMKDMNFPLDLIWIRDNQIIDITANAPPASGDEAKWPRYYPRIKADLVLEVRAGTTQKCGIKIGDRVQLSWIKNKK